MKLWDEKHWRCVRRMCRLEILVSYECNLLAWFFIVYRRSNKLLRFEIQVEDAKLGPQTELVWVQHRPFKDECSLCLSDTPFNILSESITFDLNNIQMSSHHQSHLTQDFVSSRFTTWFNYSMMTTTSNDVEWVTSSRYDRNK